MAKIDVASVVHEVVAEVALGLKAQVREVVSRHVDNIVLAYLGVRLKYGDYEIVNGGPLQNSVAKLAQREVSEAVKALRATKSPLLDRAKLQKQLDAEYKKELDYELHKQISYAAEERVREDIDRELGKMGVTIRE